VPVYLRNIIRDYFRDRMILVEMASGVVRHGLSYGVPQGSILGPLLRNMAFNDIPHMEVPLRESIICYVNDTLVVIAEAKGRCSDTRPEGEPGTRSYDSVDRIDQIEPSNPEDRSGVVYTPLWAQSQWPLLPP